MAAPTRVARLIIEMRETESFLIQKLKLNQSALEEILHLEKLREEYLKEDGAPNVSRPIITERHESGPYERGTIL